MQQRIVVIGYNIIICIKIPVISNLWVNYTIVFQEAHLSQEKPYNELMKEREEYLEQRRQQKLYEIRLKIAARTIVKFIEDHYPAWKKKKLKSKKRIKYKFSSDRKK